MTISREEAIGLLRKWAIERNPVSVVVLAGGMAVSFSGSITAMLSNALTVQHMNDKGDTLAEFILGLDEVSAFDYGDFRNTPHLQGRVFSSLKMTSNGAECYLYEITV